MSVSVSPPGSCISAASAVTTIRTSSVVGNGVEPDPKKHCIICSAVASDKIVKDDNFALMMGLYWKGLQVDVKPDANKTFELCVECFDELLQLYQINEVLLYFESRLKNLQKAILNKNLKGILQWQQLRLPLMRVQTEIMTEWATKISDLGDSEAANSILETFEVTEDQESDVESQGDDDASKISDVGSGSGKSSSTTFNPQSSKGSISKAGGSKTEGDLGKGTGTSKRNQRKRRYSVTAASESEGSNFSEEEQLRANSSSEDEQTRPRRATRSAAAAAATKDSTKKSKDSNLGDGEKECGICLDKFDSFSCLQKHFRQHRVKEGEDKFECRYCHLQFIKKSRFVEHKKACNDVDLSSSTE